MSPTSAAEYFPRTGWVTARGLRQRAYVTDLRDRIERAKASHPRAFMHDAVGMVGFHTGPDRHIIDVWALSDPFLARLPATRPWRIGHYTREPPPGYFESVAEDANRLTDPKLASLYGVVREVTRGPIWSRRRWRAIVALNTGRTDDWRP